MKSSRFSMRSQKISAQLTVGRLYLFRHRLLSQPRCRKPHHQHSGAATALTIGRSFADQEVPSVATLIHCRPNTGLSAGTCIHTFSVFGFRLFAVARLSRCNPILIFVPRPSRTTIGVVPTRRLSVIAHFATGRSGRAFGKCMYRKAKEGLMWTPPGLQTVLRC
jgi:hypothetical protein